VLVKCWTHLPTRPLWFQVTLCKTLTFATKPWKLITLSMILKRFTQFMDGRKSCFAPNTPDPLCAKDTRHMTRFVRNGSIQRSPHHWHRLSLSLGSAFVIEIQKYARRIELERNCQTRRKLGRFTTVVAYISITLKPWLPTLVEYGTSCLYEDTNFYSILIVRSASWLKLKSSHFRKRCKENF